MPFLFEMFTQASSLALSPDVLMHIGGSGGAGDDSFNAVPIVAIVFTFLWLIVKALMAPFNQKNASRSDVGPMSGGLTDEEHAVLEKLQRTITQMESRVEALETILVEQHRAKEKYGTKL